MKINFNTQISKVSNRSNVNYAQSCPVFSGLFNKKDELNLSKITHQKLDCRPTFKMPHKIKTKAALLYAMPDDISNRRIPKELKEICKKHNVNPKEDLFIVSGLNSENRCYTLFNAFYKDEVSGKDMMQMFCLESKTDELSDLQKAAHIIFYDMSSRQTLHKGSLTSPLAGFSTGMQKEPNAFVNRLFNWADMIDANNPMPDSCLYSDKGGINPIIYAADGHCTKYKVFSVSSYKQIQDNI